MSLLLLGGFRFARHLAGGSHRGFLKSLSAISPTRSPNEKTITVWLLHSCYLLFVAILSGIALGVLASLLLTTILNTIGKGV